MLLKNYIKFLSSETFVQGSQEWINNRAKIIGCSELFRVVKTRYTRAELIKDKIEAKSKNYISAIVWGKSYEDTNKKFVELFLSCKIDNCPGSVKGFNGVTCSADGISVINTPINWIKDIYARREERNHYEITRYKYKVYKNISHEFTYNELIASKSRINLLAMFEFKCPISRILTNTVPDEYIYQILGGLDILQACNLCIYCECRFCVCTIEQLNFNDEHIIFDNENGKKKREYYNTIPNMLGFKLFIFNENNPFSIVNNLYKDFNSFRFDYTYGIDYYTIDSPVLYNIDGNIKFCDNDFIANIEKLGVYSSEELAQMQELFSVDINWQELIALILKRESNIFAIQPWKLFQYRFHRFYRLNSFIEAHSELINETLHALSAVHTQ